MRWLLLLLLVAPVHAAHTPATAALEASIIDQQFEGGFGQDALAAQALGASNAQLRYPDEMWSLSNRIAKLEPSNALETVKAILAGHALGMDVSTWHAQLVQLHDGEQFAPSNNLVADMHGIFALAAVPGAEAEIAATANYLLQQQNADGGWGWYPGGASSPDMTGAALAALHVAGKSNEPGFEYLASQQSETGAMQSFGGDNVQSTAWAAWATQTTGTTLPYDEVAYLSSVIQANGKLSSQQSLWAQLDVLLASELDRLPVAGQAPPLQSKTPTTPESSDEQESPLPFLAIPAVLLALAARTTTIKRRHE